MCLNLEQHAIPQVTEEDIVCYKVLQEIDGVLYGRYMSEYIYIRNRCSEPSGHHKAI